jgi:tetratricopeptide (TPR) repeat protein
VGPVHIDEAPADFLRALARAETESAEERWEHAAALWGRVVASNPVEGRFWSKLGEARRKRNDYPGAIAAYERALELRDDDPAATVYAIACCHALFGDRVQALASFERALTMGYRHLDRAREDEDLAAIRDDPRFRELTGLVETAELSRDEGWRLDLRVLAREVKRRAYAPYRSQSERQFDAAVSRLDAAIPQLTDMQIIVEMNKLLRPLGDGHAWVWPPDEDETFRQRLPVQFYLFEEGLFIVAAEPPHADLLGTRVLGFGAKTVEEAIAAVDAIVHRDNGNSQWAKCRIPRLLRIAPLLHALGVTPSADEVVLAVSDRAGEARSVPLQPKLVRADAESFPRPDALSPEGWRFLPDAAPEPLPLYLRNVDAPYWFTLLEDERILYFQFNAVRDDPREPLADFGERLFGFIAEGAVAKLVIDLRWNGGGNTFLELPLLHRLIGSPVNRRGGLYAIIGRATFSAAQNFCGFLDRHTEAIFVGEPTGSSPTFVGETVEFALPWSKTSVNVSDLLWQGTWPMDYRVWIAPTLYAPPTFAAFRANRDPALEAVLACREHLPGW